MDKNEKYSVIEPDDYDCFENCGTINSLCLLIDKLVKNQQYLELQCIGLRYELSKYLSPEHGEFLKEDILSALGDRYDGESAYELYKNLLYRGHDPMASRKWIREVEKASRGDGETWFVSVQ